jgi:ABC-type branched-subunit amino acid transport system substrate-binding protein
MRGRLLIGLLALAATAAVAETGANDDAASGRRIFRRGGAADEVIARFSGTNAVLPPRVRRCAACHGPDGRGAREGGREIPPVSWAALAAPRAASPGQAARPGYDEASLTRALADGVDPAGLPLAFGMPRFQLTAIQAAALIDYLKIVGTERDLDPGIAANEIRVGAVLPLSGTRAAWGRAMRSGLQTALTAAGPIYGRQVRLIAADAGDDVAAAWRGLAASGQVFALVATLLPAGVEPDEEMQDMPVIGPLAPTPMLPAANHFYLLAPVEDQMRVLVDELAGETPHSLRFVVIGRDGSAADAVADQATRDGVTMVRRANTEDLDAVLPPADQTSPDAVLALPGVDLGRLVAQLAGRRGDWLLAGPAQAIALDEATDRRLRLVLPVLPSDPKSRDPSATAASPPLAIAAAAVFVEGLKRMGASASRAGLIAALETLRDFPTDVLPPLNFGRGQHRGSPASVVIRPDPTHGIIALGGWRTPH